MLPIELKLKSHSHPKRKDHSWQYTAGTRCRYYLTIVYWNVIKKSFIRDKVKSTVYEKSNRLYDIHYDDMELDEVTGYLSITNMKLRAIRRSTKFYSKATRNRPYCSG